MVKTNVMETEDRPGATNLKVVATKVAGDDLGVTGDNDGGHDGGWKAWSWPIQPRV